MKNCFKCGNISLKSNFYKNSKSKDGLRTKCKTCCKNDDKKHYNKNRNLILSQHKNYYNENRDLILDKRKNYYNENYNKIINRQVEYQKYKRATDPNFKLIENLRSRTRNAFKSQNIKKSNKTLELVGCTKDFFQSWIQFQLYGNMTVENYGKIWTLDHTIPISSFNLSNENEKRKCFFWSNLRPMYVKENISKGNKIDMWLYALQEIKGRYFLKLNVQEAR